MAWALDGETDRDGDDLEFTDADLSAWMPLPAPPGTVPAPPAHDAGAAEALGLIEQVANERKLVAYTSASAPDLRDEMMLAACQAGALQRALVLLRRARP